MSIKSDCGSCVNTWCTFNGKGEAKQCSDYYPKTYVYRQKAGDNFRDVLGWYDDRSSGIKYDFYNKRS